MKLKEVMNNSDITFDEACIKLHIPFQTMLSYRSGVRTPRLERKMMIAELYGLEVSDIWET